MEKDQLRKILDSISHARLAIIGDFCLDAYWFVNDNASEISIETGEPTRPVAEQKYSLGGAGNVASNLSAMRVGDIRVFGVIGPDPFGKKMKEIMDDNGMNSTYLLTQENNWATHVYIKPYIGDRELSRIDFGNFNILSENTADRLIQCLRDNLSSIDVVIINQQVPSGIHTPYFRKSLISLIADNPGKLFIADSRNFSDEFTGAYRKMNDTEASRLYGVLKDPSDVITDKEINDIASALYSRYKKPLFITRGSRGSMVADENGITDIPGLMILSKVDTVGAGDSYLAGAASALASGFNMVDAGVLGSYVAGVTVQKLFQTGTASPEEILAIGSDPDLIYNPSTAEDIRSARYLENTEIEIINKPKGAPIKYAIFDNDGTISTLREGWEILMAPVMVKAILGEKYDEADGSLILKVRQRVAELIDKTTGVQTLMQMRLLIGVIREFGIVPEGKILDEAGYKEIYNRELLNMVKEREQKLKTGELTIDDFTIKNSVRTLQTLYNKGIRLYLASGTDEEDVKHEAALLGYDKLFEGRIFGSVGDINKDAKKIVLDRILDIIGKGEAGSIITFGDGPVEIRETHKRGGITVGVASNELRRFGLNESKRTRVIKAGADIVIPDFSQSERVLELLNIK